MTKSPINIEFKPKSILGFIIGAGIVFLFFAGLSILLNSLSAVLFFCGVGVLLLAIGIPIWLFKYIIK